MRFISKYPGFKVTAIPGEDDLFTGRPKRLPIIAKFKPGFLYAWEVDAARRHFKFNGLTQIGEPGAAGDIIDPSIRVSYYDTLEAQREEGWSDEFREQVEQGLLSNPFHGSEFLMVEQPELPAPWPKYDELVAHGRRTSEMVAEKIAETVRDLGLDPEEVIAYERANRNREEVVNAILGVQEEQSEGEVEVRA